MTDLLRIDIDGGKYTLIQQASGKTTLRRYDEPWVEDLHGVKAILSMGYELEALRKVCDAAKHVLANAARPGSRSGLNMGLNGEDIDIPHHEVEDAYLDTLREALSEVEA